jgi:hypothetical protein
MFTLTVVRWIHLSAAALMVGGMAFVYFVLRPALARQAEEPVAKELSSMVRRRFRMIAMLLVAAILGSGIVNIIVAPPRGWWIVLLIVKILLSSAILYLYFRNAFEKACAVAGAGAASPPPEDAADASAPEKPKDEWKTAWLLAPSSRQLTIELILIGAALVVILLGVILAL